MTPPSTTPQSLLAHAAWVRALAGALVRDPNLAEDLVQETWLAALERGPRDEGPVRAWLAAVLRNVLRQRRRGEGRRAAHEERASRAEAGESTFDVIARAQDQRGLVEAVLALDEPYRTTILLRYFEGLPPRAIAERRAVPLATVKSQLARGLERLRARLDRDHGGDRRAWIAALAPLAPKPGGLAASSAGALLVETKWKLVVVGGILAGALTGSLALQSRAPAALPPIEARAAEPLELPDAPPPSESRPAAPEQRVAVVTRAAAPTEAASAVLEPAAEPTPIRMRGRAFDDEGRPLAGAELRFAERPLDAALASASDDDLRCASGADGWFELEPVRESRAQREGGFVLADGASRATVLAARFARAGSEAAPIVVVAPSAPLAGRVVDEAGAPIAGAHVAWLLPEDFRARFRDVLDDSVAPARGTRTAADGSFALPDAPAVRDSVMSVEAEAFEPLRAPAPQLADAHLLYVLRRPVAGGRTLAGRVVDAQGDPVEGAHVALGLDTTRSDARGLFEFDLELDPERSLTRRFGFVADRLMAIKQGFLPAERRAERDERGDPVWPAEVVLRLAGEPLSISGRVVRSSGGSTAGVVVWVADPTLFGEVERGPALAESVLAGTPGERWRAVETDAEGRFAIDALLDKEYRVEAMDPRTLLRVGLDGVKAGTERVELVLSDEELYPLVAGRLVSRHGAPVAQASIHPMCDALVGRHQGRRLWTNHSSVEGTRTDEEGRFELHDVPRDLVYLRIDGEELIPLEYGRDVEGGLRELCGGQIEELEIVVPLRCHLKVELAAGSLADSMCVLDDSGARLVLNVYEGSSRMESEVVPLSEGRSATLALSDSGVTLVLLRGDEELARHELELTPGEVNVVRP